MDMRRWGKRDFPGLRDYGEKPIKVTITATTRNGQTIATREERFHSSWQADQFRNASQLELQALHPGQYVFVNYGH